MGREAATPTGVKLTDAVLDLFTEEAYAALSVRGVTAAEVTLVPNRAVFTFPALGAWFRHEAFDRVAFSPYPAVPVELDEQCRAALRDQGVL